MVNYNILFYFIKINSIILLFIIFSTNFKILNFTSHRNLNKIFVYNLIYIFKKHWNNVYFFQHYPNTFEDYKQYFKLIYF